MDERVALWGHLSALTGAGVHLDEALVTIAHLQHGRMKKFVEQAAHQVAQGMPFDELLAADKKLFTSYDCAAIRAGYATGNLSFIVAGLYRYYAEQDRLMRRTRAALIIPLVAACFFIIVMVLVFSIIVPRFAVLLSQFKAQLPLVTRIILAISEFCTSVGFIFFAGVFCVLVLLGIFCAKTVTGQKIRDRFLLHFSLMRDYERMCFMRTLRLLLEGHVPLVIAVRESALSCSTKIMRHRYEAVARSLDNGVAWSDAIRPIFSEEYPEIFALMQVGERSGALSKTLLSAQVILDERFIQKLEMVVGFIQPVFLILLGLAVATVMIAVYAPMVTLVQVIK